MEKDSISNSDALEKQYGNMSVCEHLGYYEATASYSEVSSRSGGQSVRHKPILFSSYIGCALPFFPRCRPLSFEAGLPKIAIRLFLYVHKFRNP